jgi:hypothetical protein
MKTLRTIRTTIYGIGLLWSISSAAGVAVDLDATTPALDTVLDISKHKVGDTLYVGVIILDVQNLDTYSFNLGFDSSALKFMRGAESFPGKTLDNFLRKNENPDSTPLNIISTGFKLLTGLRDTANGDFTLAGDDSSIAPDGSGLVAAAMFKIISLKNSEISLSNCKFLDYLGPPLIPIDRNYKGRLQYNPTGLIQTTLRNDFHFIRNIFHSNYYTLNGRTASNNTIHSTMIYIRKDVLLESNQVSKSILKLKKN